MLPVNTCNKALYTAGKTYNMKFCAAKYTCAILPCKVKENEVAAMAATPANQEHHAVYEVKNKYCSMLLQNHHVWALPNYKKLKSL